MNKEVSCCPKPQHEPAESEVNIALSTADTVFGMEYAGGRSPTETMRSAISFYIYTLGGGDC